MAHRHQAHPLSPPAGLLLTGGSSSRMGTDKASLALGGARLAERAALALAGTCRPVLEVGPGRSGLPVAPEGQPGSGPLCALAAGARALALAGHRGPAVVLACDMPLVPPELVGLLAGWPGRGSAVPVWAGRPQPLCARWSASALRAAGGLAASGRRSLRPLLGLADVCLVPEGAWRAVAGPEALMDVDTPADLERAARLLGAGHPGR
ncbi:MAG TPA: NTP transferase domain-containing protein [Acidimicrobiales bacterium]|nr:NTP transferase domain-containing protein [Acidimicrobiales bacterium]